MKTLITLFFAALFLFTWAPWVDNTYIQDELHAHAGADGSKNPSKESCAFKDILSKSRTAFGYSVQAEYSCPDLEPMKRTMFVSSFGTVFPLNKLRPLNPDEIQMGVY